MAIFNSYVKLPEGIMFIILITPTYLSGLWFGTMEFYDFPINIGNVIIPTDELIFFRGVGQPPARFKV